MGRKPRYGQLLDHDPSLKIKLSPFRCQPNATILKDGQDDWLKYRDKAYVLHGFFLGIHFIVAVTIMLFSQSLRQDVLLVQCSCSR